MRNFLFLINFLVKKLHKLMVPIFYGYWQCEKRVLREISSWKTPIVGSKVTRRTEVTHIPQHWASPDRRKAAGPVPAHTLRSWNITFFRRQWTKYVRISISPCFLDILDMKFGILAWFHPRNRTFMVRKWYLDERTIGVCCNDAL